MPIKPDNLGRVTVHILDLNNSIGHSLIRIQRLVEYAQMQPLMEEFTAAHGVNTQLLNIERSLRDVIKKR